MSFSCAFALGGVAYHWCNFEALSFQELCKLLIRIFNSFIHLQLSIWLVILFKFLFAQDIFDSQEVLLVEIWHGKRISTVSLVHNWSYLYISLSRWLFERSCYILFKSILSTFDFYVFVIRFIEVNSGEVKYTQFEHERSVGTIKIEIRVIILK